MTTGHKGTGSHKHGTSGRAPKGPRFKHQSKLESKQEEEERKKIVDRRSVGLVNRSIKDLFR
jgi:hypothetical protein